MKRIIYVTIALASICSSCKKDDKEDPTPTVIVKHINTNTNTNTHTDTNTTTTVILKEITRSDLYSGNGYVSGTISSSTTNGHAFSKYFIHQLDLVQPTYSVNGNGHYVIHLGKIDKFGSITNNDKSTDITFVLSKNKNDIQNLNNFHSSIYVDSSASYITKFNINQDINTKTMTVSNVSFDLSTGVFKANYVISVEGIYTSSTKSAKIIGEISTTLKNIQYRIGS